MKTYEIKTRWTKQLWGFKPKSLCRNAPSMVALSYACSGFSSWEILNFLSHPVSAGCGPNLTAFHTTGNGQRMFSGKGLNGEQRHADQTHGSVDSKVRALGGSINMKRNFLLAMIFVASAGFAAAQIQAPGSDVL